MAARGMLAQRLEVVDDEQVPVARVGLSSTATAASNRELKLGFPAGPAMVPTEAGSPRFEDLDGLIARVRDVDRDPVVESTASP